MLQPKTKALKISITEFIRAVAVCINNNNLDAGISTHNVVTTP